MMTRCGAWHSKGRVLDAMEQQEQEQEQQQFASASMHDTDTNLECSSSVTRLRARTTSETSSSVFETASMNEANGSARSIEQSDRGSKKCAFW